MEKVRDFEFLKEMDVESLRELIGKTKQQEEEKGGQVNQLKKLIKATRQQVGEKEMEVQSLKELIKVAKQQVKKKEIQLYPEQVKQFTTQCLKHLEPDEYDEGERIGVSIAVLYRLHEVWCEVQGIRRMTRKVFTHEVQSLGYYKGEGECLVKSCTADQVIDKQQIIYYYVPEIQDALLQKQVREKIHEKLTIGYWSLTSTEYQQLYALCAWFDE